jgi:hypothetical protein
LELIPKIGLLVQFIRINLFGKQQTGIAAPEQAYLLTHLPKAWERKSAQQWKPKPLFC